MGGTLKKVGTGGSDCPLSPAVPQPVFSDFTFWLFVCSANFVHGPSTV